MNNQNPETSEKGFTLIELVIVIIIAGILATVAVRKMTASIDTAKYEQTKKELDQLAYAIAGNPDLYVEGTRTDFGYVGDVGALPPNLDALVQNPGSYATWNGPYIDTGFGGDGFKRDGWNVLYTYTDTLIRSTGSGTDIDKVFANSSADLLSNAVNGFVVDADNTMPGSTYKDSLVIIFTYPNGSGSTTTVSVNPDAKGNFNFSGIPIGVRTLRVIYVPDTDTVSLTVGVTPGRTVKLPVIFPADLW